MDRQPLILDMLIKKKNCTKVNKTNKTFQYYISLPPPTDAFFYSSTRKKSLIDQCEEKCLKMPINLSERRRIFIAAAQLRAFDRPLLIYSEMLLVSH